MLLAEEHMSAGIQLPGKDEERKKQFEHKRGILTRFCFVLCNYPKVNKKHFMALNVFLKIQNAKQRRS